MLHITTFLRLSALTMLINTMPAIHAMTQDQLDQALLDAVRDKDSSKVKTLLDKGANPNAKDTKEWSPLHLIAFIKPQNTTESSKQTFIINYLKTKGANFNQTEKTGNTPLHVAAWYNNQESVKDLLLNGADPKLKNNDNKTALDLAKEAGHNDIIKSLSQSYNRERIIIVAIMAVIGIAYFFINSETEEDHRPNNIKRVPRKTEEEKTKTAQKQPPISQETPPRGHLTQKNGIYNP